MWMYMVVMLSSRLGKRTSFMEPTAWSKHAEGMTHDQYVQENIFMYDMTFVPVNVVNTHWYLIVIDVAQHRIVVYDMYSKDMRDPEEAKRFMEHRDVVHVCNLVQAASDSIHMKRSCPPPPQGPTPTEVYDINTPDEPDVEAKPRHVTRSKSSRSPTSLPIPIPHRRRPSPISTGRKEAAKTSAPLLCFSIGQVLQPSVINTVLSEEWRVHYQQTRQTNGDDCGVYVCAIAEAVLRKQSIAKLDDAAAGRFRNRMARLFWEENIPTRYDAWHKR